MSSNQLPCEVFSSQQCLESDSKHQALLISETCDNHPQREVPSQRVRSPNPAASSSAPSSWRSLAQLIRCIMFTLRMNLAPLHWISCLRHIPYAETTSSAADLSDKPWQTQRNFSKSLQNHWARNVLLILIIHDISSGIIRSLHSILTQWKTARPIFTWDYTEGSLLFQNRFYLRRQVHEIVLSPLQSWYQSSLIWIHCREKCEVVVS